MKTFAKFISVVAALGAASVFGATTANYVQDGLVACWDGIENSGTDRSHLTDLSEGWKDIVADRAFQMVGTGFVIDDTSVIFPGNVANYFHLSEPDTANTFGAVANGVYDKGTVEVVVFPESTGDYQALLMGTGNPGVAIGWDTGAGGGSVMVANAAHNNIAFNWFGATNTISVAYFGSAVDGTTPYVNGEPAKQGQPDYFGFTGNEAYLGCKPAKTYPYKGRLYCVRLYNRNLTPEEIAQNAKVDRIRFLGKRSIDELTVTASPDEVSSVTPAYGQTNNLAPGASFACSAVSPCDDELFTAVCTGYLLYTNSVARDDVWLPWKGATGVTAFDYVHPADASVKLEWQWDVQWKVAVRAPALVRAGRGSATFDVAVGGVGDAASAELMLVYGYAEDALAYTNAIGTITEGGVYRGHLTRQHPERDCYVKGYLKTASGVTAVSSATILAADFVTEGSTDYVTDGLVAWWDGEYNAGSIKRHLDETSEQLGEWKDVIADRSFVLVSGCTVGEKSIGFNGNAKAGTLSVADSQATFDACKDGTLEIVMKAKDSLSTIALHGTLTSGMAFGAYSGGIILHTGNSNSYMFQNIDWSSAVRSYAVNYADTFATEGFVNGSGVALGNNQYWGDPPSQAYLGSRSTGAAAFSGDIYCIRLYSKRLTKDQVAANYAVDASRFPLPASGNSLTVTGDPCECGAVEPDYGKIEHLRDGQEIVCTAPALSDEGALTATCAGYQFYTNTVKDGTVWLPWRSGSERSVTYVHRTGVDAKLVWKWDVQAEFGVGMPRAVEGAPEGALRLSVGVLGIGNAESAKLAVQWGFSPDRLNSEVTVASDVQTSGDYTVDLAGLPSSRRIYARAVLTAEGEEDAVSDIAALTTPAGEEDDSYWREKGLPVVKVTAVDGTGGDTIRVAGTVEGAVEGVALRVRTWLKDGEVGAVWADLTNESEEPGQFVFTLFEPDREAARYLQPGFNYQLVVEAGTEDGVASTPVTTVKTLAAPRIEESHLSSVGLRLDLNGQLADLGAGSAAKAIFYFGETADPTTFEPVAETVVTDTRTFALSHRVTQLGKTYYGQLVMTNTTAGGTAGFLVKSGVLSLKAEDSAIYTWTGAAGNGRWNDPGNWTDNMAGECYGYPFDAPCKALFAEGTEADILLETPLTITQVDMKAPQLKITLRGGKENVLRTDLWLGMQDTTVRGSTFIFDNVTVEATAGVSVGRESSLVLENGAELTVAGTFTEVFDGGAHVNQGVGWARTTIGEGCTLKVKNSVWIGCDAEIIVNNGTLEAGNNLIFNVATGGDNLVRVRGERARVKVSGICRSDNDFGVLNCRGGFVFEVPANGYLQTPLTCKTSGSGTFGGRTEVNAEPILVMIDRDSPAYRSGKSQDFMLVDCTACEGIATENVTLVTDSLKRTGGENGTRFFYSDDTDTPKTLGVHIKSGGLVIMIQ